jgi:sec-independent protein translocase protein TatB
MFGVNFSELMVILVVALIVIGPERLPKVARTLGHLWGRAQRYINGIKADLARDMAIEEFRQLSQKVQQEAASAEQAVKRAGLSIEERAAEINAAIMKASAEAEAPAKMEQAPAKTEEVSAKAIAEAIREGRPRPDLPSPQIELDLVPPNLKLPNEHH